MRVSTWNIPICVEDPETGARHAVCSVRQAKIMLDRYWPDYHGSRYQRAEEICDEAIHGFAPPLRARQAFIAAAVEAHLRLS